MRASMLLFIAAVLLVVLALAEAPKGIGSASVIGTVVNRDGLPIFRVAVTVYDSNNNVAARTMTSASGMFWLTLPAGTYTLRLSKPGYVDKSLTFTINDQTTNFNFGEIVMDYALLISLPLSSIELPVLSTVSVPISLSNKGASAESVSINIDKSCDLDVATYAGGVKISKLTLGSGETQSLTLQIKAPFMEGKTCYVVLSFMGSLTHVRNLTVTVVSERLNLISASLTSVRATPGRVLEIPVRITNRLTIPITAKLSVSLPEGWSGVVKDSSGNIVDTIRLDQGENVQATLYMAIPKDVKPELYNVTLSLIGLSPYFIDTIELSVLVAVGYPILHISTTTPHVDAYAGKSAKYSITVANFGEADCLAVFNVTGLPEGYTWTLSDAQGNTLTQIYLPAGGRLTLYLTIGVPPLAEPGALSFKLIVKAPSTSDEVTLSLGILGRYALSFITQNFYLETEPGSTATFQLAVSNVGYSSLTNLVLTALSVPSGFTVSIEPMNVLLLKPGETATFTITVAADPTVDAGDYYVTLSIKSDQIDPTIRDLHVYVRVASSPAYAAAAVVAILIVVALLVFRRFGRR